jgi:histidyl-tRNA synthetase
MSHQNTALKAQMTTALNRCAPIILFFGSDDKVVGTVAVKNTATRQQVSVPRGELVAAVLTALNR